MSKSLGLELVGPCTKDSGLQPREGDTVAIVEHTGQTRFINITGARLTIDNQLVVYGQGGQRILPEDCYLIFTKDRHYDLS